MSRPNADPFHEFQEQETSHRLKVLGGSFGVECSDTHLMKLCLDAFGDLPELRITDREPHFRIKIQRHGDNDSAQESEVPSNPIFSSGFGLLCATLSDGSFSVIDPQYARALVSVNANSMRYPYLVRSELIELTFYTLASRALQLVPLHAACIGINGSGVLLIGDGGTGKSTLALTAIAEDHDVLSEDSVFVNPENMLMTGASNFLCVRPDSIDWLGHGELYDLARNSPATERPKGTVKLELDLRKVKARIAHTPLKVSATVMLTSDPARDRPPLRSLDSSELIKLLRREQPYAVRQPGWANFEKRVIRCPAFELRLTKHPSIAMNELKTMIESL